ncbi:MAG TPA: DUF4157 domain-containing protein [Gemmatimonadaceae bacterium]|nr:DUF4157 domain-containing protein [Gemmatimonadaceae bacterium]
MTTHQAAVGPVTLGERLAMDGRRLIARRAVEPSWLAAARPVMSRVASLPTPASARFTRVEAPTRAPAIPVTDDRDEGDSLPAVVQERLRPALGQAVSAMRVHDDAAADARARAHQADAVAVDHDVFFRAGRYRPHTPDGLALVAHEALHVRESARPAATWRRATTSGIADEERDAVRAERALRPASSTTRRALAPTSVMAGTPPLPLVTSVVPAVSVTPPHPTPAPSAHVSGASRSVAMTAAIDRELDNGDTGGGAPDFAAMRRALYQDLLGEMRTEFERGA